MGAKQMIDQVTGPSKTSDALKLIAEEVQKLSGYPTNTVQNPQLAFAYGLVIGSTLAMARDYKDREEDFERKQRRREEGQ